MNNNTGKSKRIVRYKCPYCNIRDTRENLVDHVKDVHDDMIPKGYTAFRVVFDYVNKKPMGYNGKCTECGGPTGWDEDKGRYNRQCSKPACKASYLKKFEDNMIRTQGTTRISNTAEGQEKMLANRKISGTYKFSDGGEKTYTGSYERKALEFMDQVMEIKSDDILCPGPVLEYSYQGAKHMYITDFYYQPYNLIIEVKDGGNNPNKRNMPEYRAKQIAKEQYIIKHTNYNYIRLTDNNFQQLLSVFISLKFEMLENSGERVIQVNESTVLERTAPRGEVTIYHGSSNGNYEYILANSPNNGKKWEKIRMSSFWFLEKKYAAMFATAELICKESDKKIPILIDNDMKAIILDEYKDLAQSIIKKNECYVYIKTIDGKYLTGGQGRNFPEYTLDFNVKPDEVYTCTQQDMNSSIKFVSPEYMDEVIQKYKKNKMRYTNSFLGSMIDNLIYDDNEDIVNAKRVIKGYNESTVLDEIARADIDSKYLENGDICYNLNKWPDEYNILYITGISGSGKTTLGVDIAKEFNCNRVELDYISAYYLKKCKERDAYNKFRSLLSKDCPEAIEFFNLNPVEKYGMRDSWIDTVDIIEDFCEWFTGKILNNGKKYIINGSFLVDMDHNFLYDKPLILKDINYIKTVFRRTWREFIESDKSFFDKISSSYKALKTDLSKEYKAANKKFKDYRTDMNNNAPLIEETDLDIEILSEKNSSFNIFDYIIKKAVPDNTKAPVNDKTKLSTFENLGGNIFNQVKLDTDKKVFIIKGINFEKFLLRLKEMYKYKGITKLFEKKFSNFDLKLWKLGLKSKDNMKVRELEIPLYFALEMYNIFLNLGEFYNMSFYKNIAKNIYNKTWVSNFENKDYHKLNTSILSGIFNPDYQLKDYQIEFIEEYGKFKHIYDLVGYILCFEQGLGKTLTSIALAEVLRKEQIIIVCPNSLKENWVNEIRSYYKEYNNNLDRLYEDVYAHNVSKFTQAKDPKFIIVNQDVIPKIFSIVKKNKKSIIIVDEIHNFRNIDSERSKALIKLKDSINCRDNLLMSGTPIKANATEIIPMLRMIDPYFTDELAVIYKKAFNNNTIEVSDVVKTRFSRVIYRKTKDEVLTLPNKIISNMELPCKDSSKYLISKVKEEIVKEIQNQIDSRKDSVSKYKAIFESMVKQYSSASDKETEKYLKYIADIGSEYIDEDEADYQAILYKNFLRDNVYPNISDRNELKKFDESRTNYVYFKQSCIGKAVGKILPAANTNCYKDIFDANIDIVIDYINKSVKKTVIFTPFLEVANHINEELNKKGIGSVKVVGNVNNRMDVINTFKYEDGIEVLVATIQTLSAGVTLTEADQMFFFGVPYRKADFDQACDRIHRIGQTKDVNIYVVLLKTKEMNITNRIYNIMNWSSDSSNALMYFESKSFDDEYSFLNEDTVLIESKNASTIDADFKKKTGKTFKIIDMASKEALKYISKECQEYLKEIKKYARIAVSITDDEYAGYIYWNKSGGIAPLKVFKKYRGYGVSELLLKEAIDNGGYKLGVYSDNEVAIRLYKKFGFIEVNRKTYKDGDVVIIMELKNKISESTILTNYTFLDVQSNKNKVLNYLKSNSETQKYADDIIDNYNGEIVIYNNTMIGRIFIGDKKDKGFITDLSVDKEHRGKKIGSRLIDDAISKYNGIDLVVDKDNSLAINMYKKRGFKVYKTMKDQYWMKLEKSITEGKVFDSDSIFYNKTKWDKGTINLCFVTGHSGSGKSTYAHNLEKRDGTVEVYELDDVVCVDHFSDDNLNEYGDLISSFFKKNSKYRIPFEVEDYKAWETENGFSDHIDYCKKVVSEFIKYSIQFSKTHSKRYIIEGVQILSFTEPELYKNYSIYILGTSALKSYIRSGFRDIKSRNDSLKRLISSFKEDKKDYKYYEEMLSKFRKYYKPLQEKIDKAEDEAFNELMTMVGYAPVRGIESSDAYIVNYMSNKVFAGEPSEAKIRDKIGVTNTRSLHTIIGLDDNQRLTKINKEDVHNPILYKIGKTNKEVSNILERCMESVVYKEYVYEALTGQKVYGDMSSQAEATLERVEILDEKKFKSVIESYLDSEGSIDEISRDLDNIEAKIEDLKKEGLA